MKEMQIQSLGQEDLLEKEMATHSSILAWKNPMDRGAWWATLHGVSKSQKRLSNYHLMRSVDSLEKTLMLGGIGGRR